MRNAANPAPRPDTRRFHQKFYCNTTMCGGKSHERPGGGLLSAVVRACAPPQPILALAADATILRRSRA